MTVSVHYFAEAVFAEVSVLSRALHPFIVHRQETASNFKILSNLYRYPLQIILRWPLFVSTSVTSILFEILKLNEKSIHIYLPLGNNTPNGMKISNEVYTLTVYS